MEECLQIPTTLGRIPQGTHPGEIPERTPFRRSSEEFFLKTCFERNNFLMVPWRIPRRNPSRNLDFGCHPRQTPLAESPKEFQTKRRCISWKKMKGILKETYEANIWTSFLMSSWKIAEETLGMKFLDEFMEKILGKKLFNELLEEAKFYKKSQEILELLILKELLEELLTSQYHNTYSVYHYYNLTPYRRGGW